MAIVLKLLTSRLPNVIKLSKLNTLFIIFILILCAFKWGFRWLFVFSSGVLVCCRSCLLLFFVLLGCFLAAAVNVVVLRVVVFRVFAWFQCKFA